jgi:serine/threonine protein kinase
MSDTTRFRSPVTGQPAPTRVRRATEATVPPLEFSAGALLKSRFELIALVGRGGMGSVWSAVDRRKVEARDPNPEIAVKILNSDFQQHPDAFVALQREASKAQSLAHPNIATVFDFDRDGASVFITMELLRGRSLEQFIRGAHGPATGRDVALPIIRGLAEGLGYAHRKGIVHSDLKPANIFITEDGTAKILDFGIARAVPSTTSAQREDQFDAGTLGAYTEAYATEEMVQGADPSPADDIYALGIIVYELLTGAHPYGGRSAAAARAAGMTAAPIRSLRRREWQTLARALAFDRRTRPRDATEFARRFFGVTQVRNALIAAVLVLAAVAGIAGYRNYQQSGPAVPFEALPPATQRQISADFAEGDKAWSFYAQAGIGDALTGSLTYFADAYKLHKGNREAVRGLERAADEMLERTRNDPEMHRQAAQTLADTSEFLRTYPPVVEALGR